MRELEQNLEGPNSRVLQGAVEVASDPLGKGTGRPPGQRVGGVPGKRYSGRFRLGHDQGTVTLSEKGGSMYEASEHRGLRAKAKEVQGKRVWRVESGTEMVQCSPFGVIPKKGKPCRWRLIVNLSAPEGSSVNDGIDGELSSVAYTSVDDVVRRVLELGECA